MAFESLDQVNLHSFYPYLTQGMHQPPLLKSNLYLSEFELSCISGDIELLDHYLKQHPILRNEQNLIKGLLLSIEQNQLSVFKYLLQVPIFSSIVQRHLIPIRNFILRFGRLTFLSSLENSLIKHQKHQANSLCLKSLDIAISQLLTYYQSTLNQYCLKQHYQNMLEMLAQLYQKNKAITLDEQLELPLTYEAYSIINLDSNNQNLKKAYQQHRLHTTWRLLHSGENWFNDESEMRLSKLFEKNQWLVVLMWLTASDQNLNFDHLVPIKIDERIEMFFERLSLIGDDEQQLKKRIFQSVIGHPYNQLLTEEVVIFEHERFLNIHFLNQFKYMSLQELKHILELIKSKNLVNHPEYLVQIPVKEETYQFFYQKMSSKWGAQWENNDNLIQISKEVLSDSFLILQNHQRTLVDSIRYLCQHQPMQPNFSFFNQYQNKAITSIKPSTADERVWLSYGVPDSPKS